jgi:tRNA(Ile)-lysidine synthase
MLTNFQHFITEHKLFEPSQKILLAVSGGLDSTAMAHLFHSAGFSFGIAHCNFSLRGADSDGDEAFVRDLAAQYNVPFFSKKFDTLAFSKQHHTGIQETARTLRYEWFSELLTTQQYDYLATAHHQDDHIETLFINLLRGCGISGLHGILEKRDRIIRPLLFASRKELEKYVEKHALKYREDASNQQTKYTRNKIRHHLIPLLEEIQPRLNDVMSENMERFHDAEQIYQTRIKQVISEITICLVDNTLAIDTEKLQALEAPKTFLFEILAPFGFKKEVIPDIFKSLTADSGKRFFSEHFTLFKERKHLLLLAKPTPSDTLFVIEENETKITEPIHLTLEQIANNEHFTIPNNPHSACFDYEKIVFPLIIRKPKTGDVFIPLGMKGRKKLSDFFIDQKFSQIEKENTWLLCSDDEIIWIINHRISDTHKVTPETRKILAVNNIDANLALN